MTTKQKAEAIVLIEKLRLVESEIFRISARYGVKTIEELDKFIAKGKISEKEIGEDFFVLDHLLGEKEKLEKEQEKLSINKASVWESLQDLLELPKLSLRT